jgi:hypothetical protein
MQAIENGIKAQRFSLAKLPEELLNTPYIFSQYAESDSSTSRKKQNFCSFPHVIPSFFKYYFYFSGNQSAGCKRKGSLYFICVGLSVPDLGAGIAMSS